MKAPRFAIGFACLCWACTPDPEPQPTTGTPGSAIAVPIGCKTLAERASAPDLEVDGKPAHCPAEDQVCALNGDFADSCTAPEVPEARCVASIWQLQCRELPIPDAGTDAPATDGALDAANLDAAGG